MSSDIRSVADKNKTQAVNCAEKAMWSIKHNLCD